MRNIDCILASETWEKKSNKKQQREIERLFEMEGLKMISKARTYRRGGGVCILGNTNKIDIKYLDIPTGNLEIVWALVKPRQESVVKEIIVFSFYLPPKSKMKTKLTDHIVTTLHHLLTVYPRAGIMGGGDRNDWNVSPVLAAVPRLLNLQQLPTLNGKNLDIFMSNMGPFYATPVIVPPIQADDPARGKGGDHSVPVIYPLDTNSVQKKNDYIERTSRPLPDSGVRAFGQLIIQENWEDIKNEDTTSEQDEAFQKVLLKMLDKTCPEKTVRLRTEDKPFITREIKILDRQRRREYNKRGKTWKYVELNERYLRKLKSATQEFLDKTVRTLMESAPGKAYSILKRLGAQPGDQVDASSFVIQDHISLGLTAAESADRIAQKFAEISQEFPAISLDNLPTRVCQNIENSQNYHIPFISRKLIEDQIKISKVTKGGVPGDLPVKLAKEFGPELAIPTQKIFNNIIQTGKWPQRWKTEMGFALNKMKPESPESESDLRIISLTPFFSKTLEKIVLKWLLHYVGDKIDWKQYGGIKGSSISHYLIDFISYILYNQDLKEPRAVLAAMVDFEKAFNRQNHNILITKLNDMGVPGWLLKVVIGFLEDRELILTYKGQKSSRKNMPGGGPQGTILGMFLFLILINDAGFKTENIEIGKKITSTINKRDKIATDHWKYVDDMTIAEALLLKELLEDDEENVLDKPLTYHNRTQQILPQASSKVQLQLNELSNYATENEMKINHKKTKSMLFNTAKKRDFTPRLTIESETIDLAEELKLLGVKITSDLKWHSNTSYITKKGYSRLWLIRRLKSFGANTQELLDVYCKQIRSVLEYASVVWHAGLTSSNTADIERVQKASLSVILGKNYINYQNALQVAGLESLSTRREILSLTFARKAMKNPKYKNWFVEDNNLVGTRRIKKNLKEAQTRTRRFRKSTIPYLTHLLNTKGYTPDPVTI